MLPSSGQKQFTTEFLQMPRVGVMAKARSYRITETLVTDWEGQVLAKNFSA
jgi:hypothetical protein